MSQHILQQFDEQWLAEIASGGDADCRNGELLWQRGADKYESSSRQWLMLRPPRPWLVITAALLMAALALLVAYDAVRRTEDLQRRLAAYEMANRK